MERIFKQAGNGDECRTAGQQLKAGGEARLLRQPDFRRELRAGGPGDLSRNDDDHPGEIEARTWPQEKRDTDEADDEADHPSPRNLLSKEHVAEDGRDEGQKCREHAGHARRNGKLPVGAGPSATGEDQYSDESACPPFTPGRLQAVSARPGDKKETGDNTAAPDRQERRQGFNRCCCRSRSRAEQEVGRRQSSWHPPIKLRQLSRPQQRGTRVSSRPGLPQGAKTGPYGPPRMIKAARNKGAGTKRGASRGLSL